MISPHSSSAVLPWPPWLALALRKGTDGVVEHALKMTTLHCQIRRVLTHFQILLLPVIGHGNGIRYRWLWHISLRPDAGVSDDRLVCHHPISQPLTTSDGLKIQVRLHHVLRKDPTISYVEYLTNLSNESWTRARGRYLEVDLLRDPSELRM